MDFQTNDAEYIDQAGGVARVGGNLSLFKRLLGRFVEGNHYDELERAIQSGDMENAAHQAHSLKGVSANLSLVKISSLTVELEQLLKNGADYSSCLDALKQAYGITLEQISGIMD